ncbi:energy-coupling factor transporter ATP-binding protein EcfA2 [Corynebacterium freneyi]|uniref:Energy-coupling factor transporter ATP-binding protein EcfA2 n=2 Tax=Corynebacterium freneyi TaxID=134034 RepID=A0ABS4U6W6_9CORY|nr:energy-coupling factor transporter ATP-binding protein EcfA2 [Corynebacterium freneyi]QXA54250.1 AAA family ATPase [Corynebacterium freneyi]
MQDVNRQLFGVSVTEELSLGRAQPSAEEAAAILDELGLEGMGERHPLSLSGGQRQRLAVATAVVGGEEGRGADVIIFDEPTSGLDLRAMESMAGVIRRCADRGAVVVLVTHDRELVDMVGDFEFPLTPG